MRRFHLESKLQDFLTGDCDDATRAEVEELLANDPKAKALFEEMAEAHAALLLLRERPAPPVPMDAIQRSISAGNFVARPEPELAAWGARFYKRVAAAALLLCGVSLGMLVHRSFQDQQQTVTADPAVTANPARTSVMPEPGVDLNGEITAFDLMRRNSGFRDGGELATFTPTDSVIPVVDFGGSGRR